MALVTIHRSPTPSNCTTENLSCDLTDVPCDVEDSVRSPHRSQSFSESYLAVKGAALILPQSECPRMMTHDSPRGDIHSHLQSMFYLLRSQDTIKVAVKLESRFTQSAHHRYMALVSTTGTQDLEESIILGIDIVEQKATIGLVLPIWSGLCIHLDGDGGYSVTSNEKLHIFKPVSVQAMWSSLQCLTKVRDTAEHNGFLPDGLTHTWISYYQSQIKSDRSFIAEWHAMDDIEPQREQSSSEKPNSELEKIIRVKLREMALTVDFEEVTSKDLRTNLERDLNMSLTEFRPFIDEEIVIIFRQMEAPSKIFPYLYLGTEWNASNLEELRNNGVGYILNVAREIDNFFPGCFEYLNIREYDTEDAELLKHWDKTFKFISEAKNNDSKVLVHCKMGVSRSASTVVAFAMKEMDWPLSEALKYVQKQRSCVQPNRGFMKQLETYQGILDASKQRHNKLWKSEPRELLTSTPVREVDIRSREPSSSSLVQLASKDQVTAESVEIANEADFHSVDESNCLLPISLWNECDLSSRSESQDDLLSLDLDAHSDCRDSSQRSSPVTLIRHCEVDRDVTGSESLFPIEIVESDPEEKTSNGDYPIEQGFYDISMLPGYRTNAQFESDNEASPLLHPDIILECIQEEQQKNRRILKQLRQNQISSLDAVSGNEENSIGTSDPDTRPKNRNTSVSENSESTGGLPMLTKVRPDNYWIRESVDDCLPSDTEEAGKAMKIDAVESACESTDDGVNPSSSSEICVGLSENSVHKYPEDEVLPVQSCTGSETLDAENKKMPPGDGICQNALWRTECQCSTSSKSCEAADGACDLHQNTNDVDEVLLNTNCTHESSDSEASVVPSGSSTKLPMNGTETALQRPKSIYESEDIPLEPGIVLKTKREIELRERSSSSLELSFGKESKVVQRSSSWRLDRSKSKDRNSERRRTCLPVLMPSPPSTDRTADATVFQDSGMSECSSDNGNDSRDEMRRNLTVYRVGFEEVELAPGIVRRTTKGFEEGIPIVTSSSEESSDNVHSSLSTQDEVPVKRGTVRLQTKQIEKKYGSLSPQWTKSLFDVNTETKQLKDSGDSTYTTVKAEDCSSGVETVAPAVANSLSESVSGNVVETSTGWGKAAAKRDEHRLHLSLSQKCLPTHAQSFGSPDRPRKELFSTPWDLTQKEMNTRRMSSPHRDDIRGIVGHAKEEKKTTKNAKNQQEVSDPLERNLSQLSDKTGSERISSCDATDLGRFTRTFSLRQTSSANTADSGVQFKFNRSRSQRYERSHQMAKNNSAKNSVEQHQEHVSSSTSSSSSSHTPNVLQMVGSSSSAKELEPASRNVSNSSRKMLVEADALTRQSQSKDAEKCISDKSSCDTKLKTGLNELQNHSKSDSKSSSCILQDCKQSRETVSSHSASEDLSTNVLNNSLQNNLFSSSAKFDFKQCTGSTHSSNPSFKVSHTMTCDERRPSVQSNVTLTEGQGKLSGKSVSATVNHSEVNKEPSNSTVCTELVTECEAKSLNNTVNTNASVNQTNDKPKQKEDVRILQCKSDTGLYFKSRAEHKFAGGDAIQNTECQKHIVEVKQLQPSGATLPSDIPKELQELPHKDHIQNDEKVEKYHSRLDVGELEHNELDNYNRELGKSGKSCCSLPLTNARKEDETSMNCVMDEAKHQNDEVGSKASDVVMRQNRPIRTYASYAGSDVHHACLDPVSTMPARSESLQEELGPFSGNALGLQASRKPYGRSHPLSRLSSDFTAMNTWTSS